MPFDISAPTDLEQALQTLDSFLGGTMGWDTTYTTGQLVVEVPGRPQVFTLTYATWQSSVAAGGTMSREHLDCAVTGVADPFTAVCDFLTPLSRMFLHAGVDPEPWVLVTFETAPGYFHHLYFGFVEKLGVYDGGAVASGFVGGTSPRPTQSGFNTWADSAFSTASSNGMYSFLFGGSPGESGSNTLANRGGLEIVSPDAPATTYRFGSDSAGGYFVGGGFTHAHNMLLTAAEATGLDGSVNAHPIILHAQINGDRWQTPVACVPGVRMVNINDLDPTQVVSIGGEDWQVFPLCNKYLPYGNDFTPTQGQGPGILTPGSSSTAFYNMGGATEFMGVAVKRE